MENLVEALFIMLPFAVAIYLLVGRSCKADTTGVTMWAMMAIIALFVFDTDLLVIFLATIAGFIESFPISLMVLTSILMITYMQKTGALARIIVAFKQLGGENRAFQIMLINLGIGCFLVSIGATPVTMLPPVMLALGYSATASVALPAIGFDPLCTFALLAIPAVVYADVADVPLEEAGKTFSWYMPMVSTGIALGMLLIAGGRAELKKPRSIAFALTAGLTAGFTAVASTHLGYVTLTGVIAGLTTSIALCVLAKIMGYKIIDASVLTDEDHEIIKSMSLKRALSPWIFLVTLCIITNFQPPEGMDFIPPIYDYLFDDMKMEFVLYPGMKALKLRVFWNAYVWMLVATIISIPLLGWNKKVLSDTVRTWQKRATRPTFSAAVFFAVASIMKYSGYVIEDGSFNNVDANNMILILAEVTADLFGDWYPLAVPFIGLLGGFVSGSETSSIAMFTGYHATTAGVVGVDPIVVGTANGVGGGLASVLSPAKIQNAAAVIDHVGIEGEVVRKTAPIALTMTYFVSLFCYAWANGFDFIGWIGTFAIGIALLGVVFVGMASIKRLLRKEEERID